MSKIELLPNEAIIKRDSQMRHDRGGVLGSQNDELVLTNLALLIVHKGVFGGIKDIQRLPLTQIKIVNGIPQAISGMSTNGEQQLHVYFSHGIEAFSLGEADDANDDILESLFTPQSKKEKRNIKEWCEAISNAVLGISSNTSTIVTPDSTGSPNSILGAVTASVNKVATIVAPATTQSKNVTSKCIGCRAPLSGQRDIKVKCKYCDTEQILA